MIIFNPCRVCIDSVAEIVLFIKDIHRAISRMHFIPRARKEI